MASNQARFTKRLSDHQKDVAIKAVVIDGKSVREVQRLARTGQLGIPAFELTDSIYKDIRDRRAEYEARDEVKRDQVIDDELARTVALAIENSRRITKDSTPEALARNAKTLASVKRSAREAGAHAKATPGPKNTPHRANTPSETEPPTNTPDSTLVSLLATLPEERRTGSLSDARNASARPSAA